MIAFTYQWLIDLTVRWNTGSRGQSNKALQAISQDLYGQTFVFHELLLWETVI